MKLLSFAADGKEYFGAASGDGVVTLNDKIGQPNLRAALAAGALGGDAQSRQGRQARPQARRDQIPAGDPAPGKNSLRRHQLPLACRRDESRTAEAAEHVRPLRRYAGRSRRRADPAEGLRQFRFRRRARRRHRQGRPSHHGRARARSRRRLYLLRRRQRARLSEILRHFGQEFSRHRAARAVARHHRRDSRSEPADADHAAQRHASAARDHRSADLFDPADRRLLLRLHRARAGRRHRHRHARRRRPQPQAAVVDEARRHARSRDQPASALLRARVVEE